MQKSFKLIITFLISFITVMSVFSQDDVKYKDVLLNGKPAKLNVATGEITLVTLIEKSIETKRDSVNAKPLIVSNPQIIEAIDQPKVLTEDDLDFYTVKTGDNLFMLSAKYKTSLAALKKANNLETTLIKVGQRLRVRNFDKISDKPVIWIVKKGDNLYRIAIENGTSVSAIKSLNGLTDDKIYVGQKLQLK
jgi:LysM repeat protein